MNRVPFIATLFAIALCAGCDRPPPASLLETTTFEIAREHGRFVRLGKIDTFAITLGEGPDVILLHGVPSSAYTWRFVIEPLAEDFRVHALDLPGFGFSDKPPGALYTPTWWAKIVADYMDAEGIEEAVLVGNSTGGEIATEMAVLFPDKTNRLVLLAPSGLPADRPEGIPIALRIARWPVFGPLLSSLPIRPMFASGLRDAFYDPSKISEIEIDESYSTLRTKNGMAAFFKRMSEPASSARADMLRLIRAPTLIIVGDTDRILSPSVSRRLHEVIPGSELVEWERTGHLPQEEHPDRLVESISSFALR
jgi:pimeloyl-ACP methyl ester carboxylesterase